MPGTPMRNTADIYIRRLNPDGTAAGGIIGPLECAAHSTKATRKVTSDRSKGRTHRDKLRGTFARLEDFIVSFEFRDAVPLVLAGHLMGSATPVTRAGGAATDEPITFTAFGEWLPLAHDFISTTGTALSHSTTTYAEDTDYEVNRRLGLIRAPAGSTIPLAQENTLDYAYGTKTAIRIDPAQLASYYCAVWVDAIDDAASKDVTAYYALCNLGSEKEVDWLSETPITIILSGPAQIPSGATTPGNLQLVDGVTYA